MPKVIDFIQFCKERSQAQAEKLERQEVGRILRFAWSCQTSKTVTDFFKYYGFPYRNVLSLSVLPRELYLALADRLEILGEIMKKEADAFCMQANVDDVAKLPDPIFREYQLRIVSILDKEDYYTNIPACKTVMDFFANYKIPYYNVASIERLPPLLKELLRTNLSRLGSAIDDGRRTLLERYGVDSELEFSTEEYKEYSVLLLEIIKKEDHYP